MKVEVGGNTTVRASATDVGGSGHGAALTQRSGLREASAPLVGPAQTTLSQATALAGSASAAYFRLGADSGSEYDATSLSLGTAAAGQHTPLSSVGAAPTARVAEASGYTTSGSRATGRPSSWSRLAHQVWVRTDSPLKLVAQPSSYGRSYFDALPSAAALCSERARRQRFDTGAALDASSLKPLAEFMDSRLYHLYGQFTKVGDVDGIIASMNRYAPRSEDLSAGRSALSVWRELL